METLTMSRKERDRLTIMVGIKRQELTQVQAAGLMGLILIRFQDETKCGKVRAWQDHAGLIQSL
jgi:hypothetical protein